MRPAPTDAERARLAARADRMDTVIEALRERARRHESRTGQVPPPLRDGIAGLSIEMRAARTAARR
jgi:hypothetical protein